MWIALWSWTSFAAASYSMRRSSAPLYPRPAYASFTSYAVASMQISLPSGATNAMSSSALMVCAVANAQGRPRTTNSNHHYHIYEDLLNTTPKLHPARFGELCVTDITYVATSSGWAYLSLVTDAASRLIVGWCLHPTLERQGPMKALSMAIDFYRKYNVEFSQLIHHSDRGVQYCCNEYVDKLKSLGIQISMTQTGDPLHNALAERMNNTLKNGWLFSTEDKSLQQVRRLTKKAIELYNTLRPHQSLQMRTPMEEVGRLTA